MRRARSDDADVLAELLWGDPSSEAVTLTGSLERARQFGDLMAEASTTPLWASCVVVEVDGEVVGLLQEGSAEFNPGPRFVFRVVRGGGCGRACDCCREVGRCNEFGCRRRRGVG